MWEHPIFLKEIVISITFRGRIDRQSVKQIKMRSSRSALLDESPVWRGKSPLSVDIKRPAATRFDPITAACKTWPMQDELAAIG
jgi:sugar lactone lactonase YvrE